MSLRLFVQRIIAVFALLVLVVAPSISHAQALGSDPASGDLDLKGPVEGRPASGLLGDWRIGGVYFSVTSATVFTGFGDGGPQVGACVEVTYVLAPPPSVTKPARMIAPDDSCAAPGEPQSLEWKGLITARAEGGADGTWTIGGKLFTISDATFFEGFPDARPVANTCVEVTYKVDAAGKNQALRIHLEDTCGGPTDEHSLRGPVDARPDGTRIGSWVIGGRSFTTTADSVFDGFSDAQPAAGDCVGLRYRESSDARTILAMRPAECAGEPVGAGIFEAHGLVDALPAGGTFGAWTIGGESYDARSAEGVFPGTVFSAEYGDLAVGACAVVHYRRVGVPAVRVAMKIESRPAYRCTVSAEEHELYGTITALPDTADHLGSWKIGDLAVVVVADTKLSDGPFYLGQRVKATFKRAGDGTIIAVAVEGKGQRGDERDQRERGKAYGKIITLPATTDLAGTWDIGGTSYTVNADTRLNPEAQPFVVGDCVEAYFVGVSPSARTAIKISHAGADDCTDAVAGEIGRAYGTVTAKPAAGYVGDWTIAGVTYSADGATQFEAEHGALDVGAFVEVRYVRLQDGRLAKTLRTLVPPGAGDEHRTGELKLPAPAPNALAAAAAATWVIGGTSYQVNGDTMLNDSLGALTTGATVVVNAYIDPASGARVATQVSAMTDVFLPIVLR